ncbi:MAG: hypothetical protein I3275_05410 [Candidatus Moeniiplasma glomeromycotorum]|nr:hypothetical protein [Candidatus Moeniiplasma glomeromycotorum]
MKGNYCCKEKEIFLNDPSSPIEYDPVFREYYFRLDNQPQIITFAFCPWCGTKLPKELREEFFDTLEKEYKIETDIGEYKERADIPQEFKSDEWWKKRAL